MMIFTIIVVLFAIIVLSVILFSAVVSYVQNGNDNGDLFISIFFFLLIVFTSLMLGYRIGYDTGAIDHQLGKVTVVEVKPEIQTRWEVKRIEK